jgi:RNase H-fold protein (predicted Holliday junction resolvase)
VSKNNTNEGLKGIEEYVKEYKYSNIIVTGIPHRYDLSPTSPVNYEVQKFKRKLKKLMKLWSSFRLYNCTGCVDGAVNAVAVGCLPLSQHLLARTEEAKKIQQTAAFVPTKECGTFGKGRRENHWTGTIVLDLFVDTFRKIKIQSIHPSILASSCLHLTHLAYPHNSVASQHNQ